MRPVRLDHLSWPEVDAYLEVKPAAILLPAGSTEQHGPMGLIGTDALCASAIAAAAAQQSDSLVAPPLAYTPAPFNMGFPGTVSVSQTVFRALVGEVVGALQAHGFTHIYMLNAHGANLHPLRTAAGQDSSIRIRSWWDFPPVNALRHSLYGEWEGLHATPSEVAITQALFRTLPPDPAEQPPRPLNDAERAARAGDRHGSAAQHRAEFPDGRVGAHSALARPAHGQALLTAAATAVAEDLLSWTGSRATGG